MLVCFALLAAAVLALTPPWEANDEPSHIQNVETLRSGHWYRISSNGDIESHQAPLYYAILAAYQRALRLPPVALDEPYAAVGNPANPNQHGVFVHNQPQDGRDQRSVDGLRLPSIAFGLLTILFTFIAARFVSRDRWTPAVAAAIVAFVPKFVFLSGTVNNDNLSDALGGAGLAGALALMCSPPAGRRGRAAAAAGLGLLAGALVLTKVSAALVTPGLLLAVVLAAKGRGERLRLASVFVLAALVVCGWWLVQNQVRYGDPLAAAATRAHFRQVFPSLLAVGKPLTRIFNEIPKDLYKSFWYVSGWNQFTWRWFWYLPFWGLTVVGLAGFARKRSIQPRADRRPLAVCAAVAIGALAIVWVLGLQTNTQQGRLAFVGLPAIAVLLAVGYERLPVGVIWRFALPAIGFIGTLAAIRYNVILPFS